jgi:hypothetical protein
MVIYATLKFVKRVISHADVCAKTNYEMGIMVINLCSHYQYGLFSKVATATMAWLLIELTTTRLPSYPQSSHYDLVHLHYWFDNLKLWVLWVS